MILVYLISLLPKCCFAGENSNKEGKKEKDVCEGTKDKHNIEKLKRAAISAISAAAVKAKNLAKQEEDQIRQLSGSLIEKQVRYGFKCMQLRFRFEYVYVQSCNLIMSEFFLCLSSYIN